MEESNIEGRHDFLLSYDGADEEWARWIRCELEAARFRVLSQAVEPDGGSTILLALTEAASRTDRTIIVLSRHYLDWLTTQPECAAKLTTDSAGSARTLIIVRIDDSQPSGLLAAVIFIDLLDHEESTARRRLLHPLASATERLNETRVGTSGIAERADYPGRSMVPKAEPTGAAVATVITTSEAVKVVEDSLTLLDRWEGEHGLSQQMVFDAKKRALDSYLAFMEKRLLTPEHGA